MSGLRSALWAAYARSLLKCEAPPELTDEACKTPWVRLECEMTKTQGQCSGQGCPWQALPEQRAYPMTDKPIIFSAPMVRALLDGRKTQTRRVVKIEDHLDGYTFTGDLVDYYGNGRLGMRVERSTLVQPIPYAPKDRLYVREAHALVPASAYRMSDGVAQTVNPSDHDRGCIYREGWDRCKPGPWRPSIHMPRWASRLTLTVTDVRVQRLQDISHSDARDEGVLPNGEGATPCDQFHTLWNTIYGPDAWGANPWVCALTFTVHRGNIDTMDGGA